MKFLLLQIRDADDPIGAQEFNVFTRALDCSAEQIEVFDLLTGSPTRSLIDAADIVLIGGSGNYSAVGDEEWLQAALETLRQLYEMRKPTFAICWGLQAFGRALGGTVIHDPDNGELGSVAVTATPAAADDPLFGPLGESYNVFQGHQDRVSELPRDAILLASTPTVPVQAFTFPDLPIYAVQFHPELTRDVFMERMRRYPHYVERITGKTYDEFSQECEEAVDASQLLRRFVQLMMAAK